MNITIKATHVDLTSSLKEYIEDKIGSLEKFIVAIEAHVEIDRDQHHQRGQVFHAEVNLIAGGKVIHAESTSEDGYAAIDMLIPKMKEQITKFKDKKQTLNRRGARTAKEIS